MQPDEMLFSFLCGREYEGIDDKGMPSAILVAFSGGADSSLMLGWLCQWCRENSVKLYAAHINHGIRGKEAERDRDFCIDICKRLGVELFVHEADVPKLAREMGASMEAVARDVRYDFFAKVMAEKNIPVLATAHNADDNLETVIFRLARGASLRGLCGIPPVRELSGGGFAIRPILDLTKDEIYDICQENGIEYVYDSTNSETVYARNLIRAKILPVLRELNAGVSHTVLKSTALLREDCMYLEGEAQKILACKEKNSIARLKELPAPILGRVIAGLFSEQSNAMLEYTHICAVSKLIMNGRENSSVSLPERLKAFIRQGKLCFSTDDRKRKEAVKLMGKELALGENLFGEYLICVLEQDTIEPSHLTPHIQKTEENIYKLFTQVSLQSDKIKGKLFVRGRQAGDKIRFGGMSRDLRKLMSERSVPMDKRETYPVICDDDGIVWVPNIALRDGAKGNNENEGNSCKIQIFLMGNHF